MREWKNMLLREWKIKLLILTFPVYEYTFAFSEFLTRFPMKILLVTVDLDALLALLYYFGAI